MLSDGFSQVSRGELLRAAKGLVRSLEEENTPEFLVQQYIVLILGAGLGTFGGDLFTKIGESMLLHRRASRGYCPACGNERSADAPLCPTHLKRAEEDEKIGLEAVFSEEE